LRDWFDVLDRTLGIESRGKQEHYDGYLATQEAHDSIIFFYLFIFKGCGTFLGCTVSPFPMQFFLRGLRDGACGHPRSFRLPDGVVLVKAQY
jgi:hypothetical protein